MKRIVLMVGVVTALVVGVTAMSAYAAPGGSAPAIHIKPDLTKAGAESRAQEWAEYDWSASAGTTRCTGPYENVRGHTQWACYGIFVNGPMNEEWQVNVGPYGEQTYHVLR